MYCWRYKNIPYIAAKNENKMEAVTTLKKIGTSRGFIIPARILKKHNIKENDKVFYLSLIHI